MDLKQLRQFLVLSETLNFRAAAERLHIAQPPLTVSIRKLEDEIGSPLFTRSTRGVRLTEAGRAALPDARKALFHAAEAARIARETTSGLAGRLRLGFVGSAKFGILPRLLPAFRGRYPHVALELKERSNGEILDDLESNALDVGIIRVPFAQVSSIRYETVETDVFMAALPVGHRLAAQERVSVTDLIEEPFVHYSASSVPGLHVLSMLVFQSVGQLPRLAQEAVQVDTVICLVESGLGVALVPSVVARAVGTRVVLRDIDPLPAGATIGLAVAYNPARETAAARRFREFARANEAAVDPLTPGR